VRVLLDTHAFLWWDDDRLPRPVTRRIQKASEVFVSAVTAWEIAIKSSLGKIVAKASVADAIADYGFSALPILMTHADAVRALPALHRDPFDRMLVAQATVENLAIVSSDDVLRQYKVPVLWD
jgi:PIN domain nuclease of toxin-antitoxin system